MCTALTYHSVQKEVFFGRTMDFSHPIHPTVFLVPQNYEWESMATTKKQINKYRFLGIGQQMGNLLAFFEGINEFGFSIATLYFEGYADFSLPVKSKKTIGSIDVVQYLLGNCTSVEQISIFLKDTVIVGIEDPVTNKIAPLHWIATDKTGACIVIEQTSEGLKITPNPIGVFSNSPTIDWHLTNLRNYMGLTPFQKQEVQWGQMNLVPFSQGGGTAQLPGGFTSPERFVRTAFLKSHAEIPNNQKEAILNGFHILGNVFIPKGVVITPTGDFDYTKYVSIVNLSTGEYFFKTYNNDQIYTVKLDKQTPTNTQLQVLGSLL